MKVPTYTAKLDRPRRGQGQFLTAQLSGSAMAAPARAFARSGQQLAQVGSDLAAFGMKKAQIGADAEAQAASLQLDIELQKMQQEFLANPNMQQAEQKYQDMARLKVETFKSGLSNRLARDAFRGRAAQVTLRNQTSFLKANNARVVEQRKVLLNNDTDDALTYATNPSNSPESRAEVANLGLRNLDDALRDLGPELHAKLRKDFYQRLAKGSLINAINKGLDAEQTLEDFRTNKSADPVVSAARQNLSPSDVDKIYGEVVTATNRTRTLVDRKQKRQRTEIALNFETELKTILNDLEVNADMADDSVATNFNERSTQMINDAVDAHEGTEESKANLSIELRRIRASQVINVGELQQTAKRKRATGQIGDDLRALVTDVSRDPNQLGNALETLEQTISNNASYLSAAEEEAQREGGQEEIIEATLNSLMSKGDINGARELFNSSGIAQALTPTMQETFRQKFTDFDNERNAEERKYRAKIELHRKEFGTEPTGREKRILMGMKGGDDLAEKFRKDFEAKSKRFLLLRENFDKVQAAANNVSPAGDVSLIFGFMKMIDPGSVVRESEFATAANTGSIPERVWAQFNRARRGQRLTATQRADFLGQAKNLYKSQEPAQRRLQERFNKLADAYEVPRNRVVVMDLVDQKMTDENNQTPESATPSAGTGIDTSTAPSPDTKTIMLNAEGMRLTEEPK